MNKLIAERIKNARIIDNTCFIEAVILQMKNDPRPDTFSEGEKPYYTQAEIDQVLDEVKEIQSNPAEPFFNQLFTKIKSNGSYDSIDIRELSDEDLEKFLVDIFEDGARWSMLYLRTQKIIDAIIKRGGSYFYGEEVAHKISELVDKVDDQEMVKECCSLTDEQIQSIADQCQIDLKTSLKNILSKIVGKKQQEPAVDAKTLLKNAGIGFGE